VTPFFLALFGIGWAWLILFAVIVDKGMEALISWWKGERHV
jgi:hypothetical protein